MGRIVSCILALERRVNDGTCNGRRGYIRIIAIKRLPQVCGGPVLSNQVKLLLVFALLSAILCLAGCPGTTSIAKISRDPGHFAGQEVTISGRVTDSFGALGNGVFQIDDATGTMWVFSQSYGVPSSGARVSVTGRVEQGFSFAGRSFATILRETQPRR